MSIPYNESAIPGRHTLSYRVRDGHTNYPRRDVEVLAMPGEIETLVRDGYLVRERLLSPETVERLREALDVVLEADAPPASDNRTFGGTFLRHLSDKHPAFFDLVDFAPVVSVARALFGPAVALRGLSARVCDPDDPHQEVSWHFHQRVVPDPLPPLFQMPQVLDCLIYLDDTTDERNGPLCVLPGSHHWTQRDLDKGTCEDLGGQVVLGVPAGSGVLTHGSLWHRALPTLPGGTRRRLLILGYSPAWQKGSIYGEKPEDGLTTRLLQSGEASEEMRELLGVSGYM